MSELCKEDVRSHVTEYEVTTDADIIGACEYGPYYFTIWEFSIKQPGQKRKLCLRIREKEYDPDSRPWEKAKRDGFYHGGGIADELIALATLFLRRRLELGAVVRVDEQPRWYTFDPLIDKEVVAGQGNIGHLPVYLKLIENLNSELYGRLILSVRLYHRALVDIEEQPDIAYLNLVSSIETLCQDYPISEVVLSEYYPEMAELLKSVEDGRLRALLEKGILKRERFIGRRFVINPANI